MIGDAAGGQHRNLSGKVPHRGQQREKRALAAVAAGFGALRDEHIGLGFERLTRDRQALYLADELRAALLDLGGERARIAERQHHGAGLALEREIEELRLLRQAPGNEANTDARIAGAVELASHPLRIAVAGADQAEAAGARHRGGEAAAGDESHRRQHQRSCDAEYVAHHVVRPARSFSFCALIMARIFSQSASDSWSSSVKYAPEPVAR